MKWVDHQKRRRRRRQEVELALKYLEVAHTKVLCLARKFISAPGPICKQSKVDCRKSQCCFDLEVASSRSSRSRKKLAFVGQLCLSKFEAMAIKSIPPVKKFDFFLK